PANAPCSSTSSSRCACSRNARCASPDERAFPPLQKDRTMTRIFAFALAALTVTLAACGGDAEPQSLEAPAPAAAAQGPGHPGFSRSQYPAPQGDVQPLPPQF